MAKGIVRAFGSGIHIVGLSKKDFEIGETVEILKDSELEKTVEKMCLKLLDKRKK